MTNPRPMEHVEPTHISVTFKILMPDKLRKISFNLKRDTDSDSADWSITFQLYQRESIDADFPTDADIELNVEVSQGDKDANAQAAATAKHGLDPDQRSQALSAADVAQAAKDPNSEITEGDANDAALGVITSRNAASPA